MLRTARRGTHAGTSRYATTRQTTSAPTRCSAARARHGRDTHAVTSRYVTAHHTTLLACAHEMLSRTGATLAPSPTPTGAGASARRAPPPVGEWEYGTAPPSSLRGDTTPPPGGAPAAAARFERGRARRLHHLRCEENQSWCDTSSRDRTSESRSSAAAWRARAAVSSSCAASPDEREDGVARHVLASSPLKRYLARR